MSKQAKIMIVGRTNVGKSTLFNRIGNNIQSLTLNQEGVTRDCVSDIVDWNGVTFELVDTGGISVVESKNEIERQVQRKCYHLMK